MHSAVELERRTDAEDTRGERRKQKLIRATIEKDKKDGEKFSNILYRCKQILSTAMNKCDEIFELLDPLISDAQCHLHSVLIIYILQKCYNNNESSFHGIDKLDERDQKILSYAVLFSLLKVEYKDKFGFVLHQVSMNHLYGSLLSSRNRESYYICEAKKMFNSFSVDYIKSVASPKVKEILNQCTAVSSFSPHALLPSYASTYAVIDFIEERKLPIILSLVIIDAKVTVGATKYNMHSNDVLFYEFRENEKKFVYKKELSDYEKKIPTIVFSCYNITTESTKKLQLAHDIDVRELLMISAAGHIQLPKNSNLPISYKDGEEYARKMYEKDVDFFIEYNKHYELAKERNLINARYSRIVRSPVEQGGDHSSFTIERRREETSILDDHVHVSNYLREYKRLKSLDFSSKLDQYEFFEFSKKKETLEVVRRLTVKYKV